MKTMRKNIFRRGRANAGGLRKFLLPPDVLIFRELRRMETQERQPDPPLLLHRID